MRASAVRALTAAGRAPITAAALVERTVQIWDWNTGEYVCEFDTVFEHGGDRLAINPTGEQCVAANWKKGKRGGVACYSARSGEQLWHRTDLRQVQGVRFSAVGNVIWCQAEGQPVRRLEAKTGLTLGRVAGVQNVVDSRHADHRMEVWPENFLIEAAKKFGVQRLTYALLDATFSLDALCLTEAGGIVRCLDCGTGNERWRYQPPKSHHVLRLYYGEAHQCFYGVRWDYMHGGPVTLMRFSQESGAPSEICQLNSFPDSYCFAEDVIVTSGGDVVSLADGTTLRQLTFPQRDYPDSGQT